MTAIKSQHSRTFEQLMAEYRQKLLESLATSVPADYAAYRQIVGQIEGLATALAISEQADFNISGEEPNGNA